MSRAAIPLKPIERLTVTALIANTADGNIGPLPVHISHEADVRQAANPEANMLEGACKGVDGVSLSLLAEDGESHKHVLFDVGPDAKTWLEHHHALGTSRTPVDDIILSHGHFDHVGALVPVVDALSEQKKPNIHINSGTMSARGISKGEAADGAEEEIESLGPCPDMAEIADKATIVCEDTARVIADGMFYISGPIARDHGREALELKRHRMQTPGGYWVPDPFIMDERYAAVLVKDRGLVVFSGCGHAGIINILDDVQRNFPGIPIDTVIGGWHTARYTTLIAPILEKLPEYGIRDIVTGHCTGFSMFAKLRIARDELDLPESKQSVQELQAGRQYRISKL